MTLDYKLIGNHIKEVRKGRHISQEYLAELTDLSVTYISQIERAAKHPSLQTLVAVANALSVTADRLLYENQQHNRSEYEAEFIELIGDCSSYERVVIYETIFALKRTLRTKKYLKK